MTCVLIMSSPDDLHALSVARSIRSRYPGVQSLIVSGDDFPTNLSLSIEPSGWCLIGEKAALRSTDVLSVWWRRPGAPRIEEGIADANSRDFARRESMHAFDSIALSNDYPVINRPDAEYRANKKPVQLWEAQKVGLRVPEYCITNKYDSAIEFINHYNDVIFKSLTSPRNTFGETRQMKSEYLELLHDIDLAPAIFQRRIKRKRDYRVTVIGQTTFVHEIFINNESVRVLDDWRLDVSAEARKASLSEKILQAIASLMARLSLSYGAVDLIEDENGEVFFLEVNSSGQFLFAEMDTADPMSLAFADLLCKPAKRQ